MKRILLSLFTVVVAASSVIAGALTYSNTYIEHLRDCSVHIEKYNATIPSDDNSTPELHIKSTESVLGWQNGKCMTKSVVYSEEMKQDILTTQCAFTEKQIDSIVKKVEAAQSGNIKDKQALQDELTQYVQDSTICKVENLIKQN